MKTRYTKEFKVNACKLVVKKGQKPADVAEKLGINKIMLYRWVQEYKNFGKDAFVGTGNQRAADAENKKLRKRIQELEIEREILLKAAAYFDQHRENE